MKTAVVNLDIDRDDGWGVDRSQLVNDPPQLCTCDSVPQGR